MMMMMIMIIIIIIMMIIMIIIIIIIIIIIMIIIIMNNSSEPNVTCIQSPKRLPNKSIKKIRQSYKTRITEAITYKNNHVTLTSQSKN